VNISAIWLFFGLRIGQVYEVGCVGLFSSIHLCRQFFVVHLLNRDIRLVATIQMYKTMMMMMMMIVIIMTLAVASYV